MNAPMRNLLVGACLVVVLGCSDKKSAPPVTGASSSGAPLASGSVASSAAGAANKPKFARVGNDSIYDMTLDDFRRAQEKLAKHEDPSTDCITAVAFLDSLK